MASTNIQSVGAVQAVINEARTMAHAAAQQKLGELGGDGRDACGFAQVNIYSHNGKKIDGRSKMGKLFKQAGVRQDYDRVFYVYNPSGLSCQSISALEAGAKAAADTLRSFGFDAYASSRID